MNILSRILKFSHGAAFVLSVGLFVVGFGATPAFAINWDAVEGKDVVLFHPGQASWEWILTQKNHSGAQKFKKGKNCRDCHEDEQPDIGELIATGEKVDETGTVVEPEPMEGNIGHVSVNIKFARDDTKLYTRLEWVAPAAIAGDKQDPDFESKVTLMFAGDEVREAVQSGCWGTCHTDADSMPDAGKDELTKYLSASRAKLSRQGGGTNYKSDAEIAELLKGGNFMEYWQARLNPGSPAAFIDGYILKDREEDNDGLVAGEASFADGKWTVVLSRALEANSEKHHNLAAGSIYHVGFALHDNHKHERFHNVSFEYTFVLDAGEADFVAVKQ